MAEKKLKFEDVIRQLEAVVADLEAGNVSLDDSLALYEKGMKLVRVCNQALDAAEQRVEAVRKTEQGIVTEPFAGDKTE